MPIVTSSSFGGCTMLSLCMIVALSYPALDIQTGVVRSNPILWEERKWKESEADTQKIMRRKAAVFPKHPVIVGHSSPPPGYTGRAGRLFANLHKAAEGDTISVRRCNRDVEYTVTKTWIEHPKNVARVLDVPDGSIRIFTCYPPGSTLLRFVVEARETDSIIQEQSGAVAARLLHKE